MDSRYLEVVTFMLYMRSTSISTDRLVKKGNWFEFSCLGPFEKWPAKNAGFSWKPTRKNKLYAFNGHKNGVWATQNPAVAFKCYQYATPELISELARWYVDTHPTNLVGSHAPVVCSAQVPVVNTPQQIVEVFYDTVVRNTMTHTTHIKKIDGKVVCILKGSVGTLGTNKSLKPNCKMDKVRKNLIQTSILERVGNKLVANQDIPVKSVYEAYAIMYGELVGHSTRFKNKVSM